MPNAYISSGRNPGEFPVSPEKMLWAVIGGKYRYRRWAMYREFLRPFADTERRLKREPISDLDKEVEVLIAVQMKNGISEETFHWFGVEFTKWQRAKRVEKAKQAAKQRWKDHVKAINRKHRKKIKKKR